MVFMTGYPESALTEQLPGPLLLKPFDAAEVIRAILVAMDGATSNGSQ
jgi:hypothetical protein